MAPATVKREYQAFQKLFTWAVDEAELIVRNPCRKIRFASSDEDASDRRFYTPGEIEQLYEAFDKAVDLRPEHHEATRWA